MSKHSRLGLEIKAADSKMRHHPGVGKAGTSVKDLNPIPAGLRLLTYLPQVLAVPKGCSLCYTQ